MRAFRWLYLLFFLSGFPALLYQIVWQRALFAIYGVNIESVTVVVSAFMLGLGLGSLAGGRLSERPGTPLLAVFGVFELGIAAFGVCSLPLFHRVAAFTAGAPPLETGFVTLLLVLLPTVLMGATLPLLVAHLVRLSGNVGRSVGVLYFVNTLGSAAACFAAAWFTMPRLGMSGTVYAAAALNALIGSSVLALHFRYSGAETAANVQAPMKSRAPGPLPFPAALLLSGTAGFLSLGYEILWYRVYSFVSGGTARSFAYVLGAFLGGIAFGSLGSRRLCRGIGSTRQIALVVLLANLAGFATIPLIAALVRSFDCTWALAVVGLAAALLGAAFPLACHLSVRPDAHAGAGMSYLYLANIAGSTLGSFTVGFILMDAWTLRGMAVFLAALGIAAAALLLPSLRTAAAAVALIGAAAAVSGPLFTEVYEKLQYQSDYVAGQRFTDIVETRSGVITVDAEGTVYGGGHYDGMLVTDLTVNDAPLRPYAVSFFHPDPRDVLLVGMASGAWAEVIANHPQVRSVTMVEINPGYVTVMRRYPEVAPLLSNPKAELVIDDGRRWLVRNPGRRFDLILMDTTSHWRAHATNLLSREFLELARGHLKPGGILYYNTSHSPEAQRTALDVFPYAYRFGRFLAVSDSPIPIDLERWRRILIDYRLEGRPVFDLTDAEDRARLEEVLGLAGTLQVAAYDEWGMEDIGSIRRRVAGSRIVTDDNMACEWRR